MPQQVILDDAENCSGNPSPVVDGETGLLTPPSNPDALAAAICRLLENPEEARAMGLAGRKRVEEKFSWTSIARQTKALYEEITSKA